MYDVIIIGAGASGIEAAKRALRYNLKTLLIDRTKDTFGGICLNQGCIPTKYYLRESRHTHDIASLYRKKNVLVNTIKSQTLQFLASKGTEVVFGYAHIKNNTEVLVGSKTYQTKNVIIATGSLPSAVGTVTDEKLRFGEDLFSDQEPGHNILIVGAGYVGLELACILHNLGKKVHVLEKESRILPTMDKYISARLKVILEKKGITFSFSSDLNTYFYGVFDTIYMCAGRRPNTEHLAADEVALKEDNGWIQTDASCRTSSAGIYAIGDCCGKKLLAYTGSEQARIAIDTIAGKERREDFSGLAYAVFTQPQCAYAGILEEEARAKNIDYTSMKSNFMRFSSSYVYSDTDGFIQIIFDSDKVVIGAAVISNVAAELISVFSLAIRERLTLSSLACATFIHPTISEIISEMCKDQNQ